MLGPRAAGRASPILTALRPFVAAAACRPQTGLSRLARRDVPVVGVGMASSVISRVGGGLATAAARRPQSVCMALRSLSTDADKDASGSIISSVFEGEEGGKPVADDDIAAADRHQNRNPKARALAEGKKTLKPWSGGGGGGKQNELIIDVATEHVKILIGKRGAKVQVRV